MHPTAMDNGRLFFECYFGDRAAGTVVDVGSTDVNGSLRSLAPAACRYVGVDFVAGPGVDVVLDDPYKLPFEAASVDAVVSSSCFEHVEFFWLMFNEVLRVLKPDGLFYLNAPSNGEYHRYPVDCWRFYPDAGMALVNWGRRSGYNPALLESFTSRQRLDVWNDCVAVFVKDAEHASSHPARILERFDNYMNGRMHGHADVLHPQTPSEDLAKLQKLTSAPKAAPSSAASRSRTRDLVEVAPRSPARGDCLFYHAFTLPEGEVPGMWDLRAQPQRYLGEVDFNGRSVLEVGPASGFLSFFMERAGAQVTCLEPPMSHLWDVVPFEGFDTDGWRAKFSVDIQAVRNSFWYAHHALGSKVRMIETDPYDIPEAAGQFDVGVFASVLLHCRRPFDMLESAARRVRKTIVVTEEYNSALGPEALCLFQPHRGVQQVHTWWQFTPQFFVSALGLLGFSQPRVVLHTQRQPQHNRDVSMFTVVCERAGPAESRISAVEGQGTVLNFPAAGASNAEIERAARLTDKQSKPQPAAPHPDTPAQASQRALQLPPMDTPTTSIQRVDMELAAVNQLRWYPNSIAVGPSEITMAGWALGVWDQQDEYRFLVNGVDFEVVEWPLPSPDLIPLFGDVPYANASRFRCRHRRGAGPWPFEDGFARFNVTTRFGEHALTYRTAWYVADPALEAPMPGPAQIARVIGAADEAGYRMSGATLAMRLDEFLRQRFGRPITSFESVLDWGCGAGRLTRYISRMSDRVIGVDIDADNIAMCERHFPAGRFLHIDRYPPAPFPDRSFDLVFGLSVFTHLDEVNQNAWLSELRRIVRPDGVLLLTIMGRAQAHLYQDRPCNRLAAEREGIHITGVNSQLDEVLANAGYYQNAQHSHDYILARWSEYFDVLDIVPALACGQDTVVLRARCN